MSKPNKYKAPHQNTREKERRINQLIDGKLEMDGAAESREFILLHRFGIQE